MMIKSLVLGIAICYCFSGVNGMESMTGLAEMSKGRERLRLSNEQEVECASFDSDDSRCSLSNEEEELADRACYSNTDIVMLLAHLQTLDYSEARDKYKLILGRWKDNNMYELMDTGSSFIGCCERNYYDF